VRDVDQHLEPDGDWWAVGWRYASRTPAGDPTGWKKVGAAPGDLPTELIVGSVEIVDCVWDRSKYCYAYMLASPQRLDQPLVPRNQPQPVFWRPQF
jgi:hypothetical protein